MNDIIDDDDVLKYDAWIENALRSVIRQALNSASDYGLAGEHHFYITFRTNDENVAIPTHLKAQHPEEMTIVLQHQFDSLTVKEDFFSVVLRFNGKPETMTIPFIAITSFADPSVNFGLQLKMTELDDDDLGEIEDLEAYLSDALIEGDIENDVSDTNNVTKITDDSAKKTPTKLVPTKLIPAKKTKTKKSKTVDGEIKPAKKSKSSIDKQDKNSSKKSGEVIALDAFRKK